MKAETEWYIEQYIRYQHHDRPDMVVVEDKHSQFSRIQLGPTTGCDSTTETYEYAGVVLGAVAT